MAKKSEKQSSDNPGYAVILSMLQANSKVTFGEVREAAAKLGHVVYPISYGRAKLQLGLSEPKAPKPAVATAEVPVKRGPGRPRKVPLPLEAVAAPVKRGPGRPKKVLQQVPAGTYQTRVTSIDVSSNGSIIVEMQAILKERDALRKQVLRLREIANGTS